MYKQLKNLDNSLQRSQRSQSIMSSVSLQDSQLQFYDAIEYFTSDTESDDDSEQDSDADGADASANRTIKAAPAIVPGTSIIYIYIYLNG